MRPPYPDLSGMTREEAIRALDQIVFTAAKGWRRAVHLDPAVRDMIVVALRAKDMNCFDGPPKKS